MAEFVTEEGLENVRISDPLECSYGFLDSQNTEIQKSTWIDFQDSIKACSQCTASIDRPDSPFLSEGNPESRFVLVFRNPLSIDNHFMGFMRSDTNYNQVLQLYLKALGLYRAELYITGSLFCPISDNRIPTSEERSICGLHKRTEISFLKNCRVIVLMGEDALRKFVDDSLSIKNDWMYSYYIPNSPMTFLLPIQHVGFYLSHKDERTNILKHLVLLRHRFIDPVRKGLL